MNATSVNNPLGDPAGVSPASCVHILQAGAGRVADNQRLNVNSQNVSKEQLVAGVMMLRALADGIRELKEVPSGTV